MAFSSRFLELSLVISLLALAAHGQLSGERFYQSSCPSLQGIVGTAMAQAVAREPRMGASILRLFFHDCFVNVRYIVVHFMLIMISSTVHIVRSP